MTQWSYLILSTVESAMKIVDSIYCNSNLWAISRQFKLMAMRTQSVWYEKVCYLHPSVSAPPAWEGAAREHLCKTESVIVFQQLWLRWCLWPSLCSMMCIWCQKAIFSFICWRGNVFVLVQNVSGDITAWQLKRLNPSVHMVTNGLFEQLPVCPLTCTRWWPGLCWSSHCFSLSLSSLRSIQLKQPWPGVELFICLFHLLSFNKCHALNWQAWPSFRFYVRIWSRP